MNWTLGRKLAVGFGALIVLIICVAAVVFVKVNAVNKVQNRVTELRQPTAMAGKDMLNGINNSMALLRGYMILGEDKFKDERATAWSERPPDFAIPRHHAAHGGGEGYLSRSQRCGRRRDRGLAHRAGGERR